jgi:FAD/FMN-containing dehydrogenase
MIEYLHMKSLSESIGEFLQGDVDVSAEAIASHSRDASLFDIAPEVVVYPKDANDVSDLVKFVTSQKKKNPRMSITPRSAGTCMAGGSLNDSISLDCMRYLNGLGKIRAVTPYESLPHFPGAHAVTISAEVSAGPGAYYRDLEKKTDEAGFLLPCFTASKSINAIGGMVGNNSGGELSLKYGKTEDYIKDIEFVFADGSREVVREVPMKEARHRATKDDFVGSVYKGILKIIDKNRDLISEKKPRVSKNSAGYNIWNVVRTNPKTKEEMFDLTQLIVGSEGTLGITTNTTLKLVKPHSESALLVVFLKDLGPLADIVQEIQKTSPETIEAYDDKTIELAVRFWRGFIKQRGFWGALKLGLQFVPEFGMMIGGIPKLVLLVECAGEDKAEILARLELLKKRLSRFSKVRSRIIENKKDGEKYWMIRHDSFALLRSHYQGKRTAPFIDDVIVPPASLPQFIPAIRGILEKHKLSYNIHGHAGNGNFHIIPLIENDARMSEKMILEVSEEVYDLVIRLGGSITAEHNDGIIRTPFLADMFGAEMTEIFSEIKHIFDPKNIFNPGKKVGLTKADIGKYLIRG